MSKLRFTNKAVGDLTSIWNGRHIIFHTISESGDVTIIRILHERMDVRQRLG